jgi:hypothetical protein
MSNYFKDFDQMYANISKPCEREYSRILSAAVVNSNFCKLLLTDPEKAILGGFAGEDFNLAIEDTKKLSLIRAGSLAEFAIQMNNLMV